MGLEAGILQAGEGMHLPKETPDNSVLWPITFANKSLTSAEIHNSNFEGDVLCILYGLEKIPPLLLCLWGKYDYRSQTTLGNVQEGFSSSVIQGPKSF